MCKLLKRGFLAKYCNRNKKEKTPDHKPGNHTAICMHNAKTDWLIIFFIHEILEYKKECEKLISLICHVGPGSHNKIIIILDSVNMDNPAVPFFSLDLFEVLPRNNQEGVYEMHKIKDTGIDFSREHAWEDAFLYILRKYGDSAKRTILFTWSHGAGFGINTENSRIIRTANAFSVNPQGHPTNSLEEVRSNLYYASAKLQTAATRILPFIKSSNNGETGVYQKYQFVNNQAEICKNLEILWMDDLSRILGEYQPRKIDLLVMMNCNMQLFENGYALRRSVRYFIAAESKLLMYGYDYHSLLRILNNTPSIKPRILAKAVINTFICYHRKEGRSDYLTTTALFANSLQYYDLLFACIQQFFSILLHNHNALLPVIRETRMSMQVVSQNATYELVDLGYFMKCMAEKTGHTFGIKRLYNFFESINKKTVVKAHIGKTLIVNDKENIPKRFGHSGHAIFFPINDHGQGDNKYAYCAYFSDLVNTRFESHSLWDELLQKTVAKMPQST